MWKRMGSPLGKIDGIYYLCTFMDNARSLRSGTLSSRESGKG